MTVDEFAERVFAVDKILGIFKGLMGDIAQKFCMHLGQRFGSLPARCCECWIGIFPSLEFGGPLPLLQRHLRNQFAQEFAGPMLQGYHVSQESDCFRSVLYGHR